MNGWRAIYRELVNVTRVPLLSDKRLFANGRIDPQKRASVRAYPDGLIADS